MTNFEIIEKLKNKDLTKYENLSALFDFCLIVIEEERELALSTCKFVKNKAGKLASDVRFFELYNKCLLMLAPYDFDSYLLYIEKDREPQKRFYLPRRKTLKVVVDDLQDLEDGVIEFLGVSLPTRTGKSTLCIFYMTWQMGKYPNMANLMSGHSGKLTKGFYGEALNIIKNPEYLWADVFPTVKIERISAEDESINLGDYSRFPTLTCRSIGGTLTGAVEAANLLYTDDLIEDREESLNPLRLENKYQAYLNQLLDRKKDGCKELMVGTRWNIGDPLGRIEAQYKHDPKYRFRKIPALNENNESNFVYDYGVGFTTKHYLDLKEKLDKNEWMAKYQQAPFVREGLLFPADELNYYNGTLPGVEADRRLFACDVAWGGGDSLSMPICYQYGDNYYIHDVVFNRGDKEVTRPIVVGKIKQHKLQMGRFEANNGGDEYADKVDELLRADGYICNISHRKAPSNQGKMSRIIQFAPEIKRFYFIDDKHASKEYRDFMAELTTTVQTGKNEHDDAADSLAQLVNFIQHGGNKVEIFKRPF